MAPACHNFLIPFFPKHSTAGDPAAGPLPPPLAARRGLLPAARRRRRPALLQLAVRRGRLLIKNRRSRSAFFPSPCAVAASSSSINGRAPLSSSCVCLAPTQLRACSAQAASPRGRGPALARQRCPAAAAMIHRFTHVSPRGALLRPRLTQPPAAPHGAAGAAPSAGSFTDHGGGCSSAAAPRHESSWLTCRHFCP